MKTVARLALALLALHAAAAESKKIYKFTDAAGVVHFTDQPPVTDRPVQETTVKVEPGAMVQLRVEGRDSQRQARVFNYFAGPAQIELSVGDVHNIATDPPLPLTVVLQAREERVVASLQQTDRAQPAGFELALRAIPGSPDARHEDVEYRWPLAGHPARIHQGFDGAFSHTSEESRYAIDAAADEGTPVVAARDGVVMEVQDDYYGAGLDKEKFATRANVVRVLHRDGSMAVYAHLRPESVGVQPGKYVYAGQKLGESGNTGYSTGPHLHFCVQVNRGMRLVSVPFRMRGPDGPLDFRTAAPARGADPAVPGS
ncbi:peptidoglycan DD-metalloendopeptidase family protein [Tahibacter caeni]|uniref:peptidoglycan DD-metalloendopeptidase family protein n=1 Tax=Tahibacter caeni TaxID=1453545 RepID=UPI0021492E16|nr:peptidoglycan DD-metalloendopeptidase family protein [Tahibacter caeni]